MKLDECSVRLRTHVPPQPRSPPAAGTSASRAQPWLQQLQTSTMLIIFIFSLICLSPHAAQAEPIPVTRLADVSANSKSCTAPCSFKFSTPSAPILKGEFIVIEGKSVTLIGADGGTVLNCREEADVVITATGTPEDGSELILTNLIITNCSNLSTFLLSTGMSMQLNNVTFVNNSPKVALVSATVSPQHTISLKGVNFSANTLQPGTHLLSVSNDGVELDWNVKNDGIVQAVWQAACNANVLDNISIPKQDLLLRPDLVDTLTGKAFVAWTDAETLLQESLQPFLVAMQVEGLFLQGNKAAYMNKLPATPQLPPGKNMSNDSVIAAAQLAWGTSMQNDFIQLKGVRLTGQNLMFEANVLYGVNAGVRKCHTLLHLAASSTAINNMTAMGNRLVSVLHVSGAVGITDLRLLHYTNNWVETCSLVRFEGLGVLPQNGTTVQEGCTQQAPTVQQLQKAFSVWEGMFFIQNEYGEYTGMVKPVGIDNLEEAGVLTSDEDLKRVRDMMGLETTLGSTFDDLASNRFTAHLEYAILQKSLQSKRNSPLTIDGAEFTANQGANTSLFHITTFSQNVSQDGTLLNLHNLTFHNNSLTSSSSHPQALLHSESSFGIMDNITFSANAAGALVLQLTTANMTNVVIKDNNAPGAVLVTANTTVDGLVHVPQLHLKDIQVVNNSAAGPIAVLKDVNLQIDDVIFTNNTADLDLEGWQGGVLPAMNKTEGVVFADRVKWLKFVDARVESNNARARVMLFHQTLWRSIKDLSCSYNKATCLLINDCWTRDLNLNGDSTALADFYQIDNASFVGNVGNQQDQAAGLQITNLEWQKFEIFNCTFADNVASSPDGPTYGGALGSTRDMVSWRSKQAAYVHIYGCNFFRNKADIAGAAHFEESQFSMHDCNFINNSATQMAGAVYVNMSQFDYMFQCTFEGNTAPQGGALVALIQPFHWHLPSSLKTVHIIANTFRANSATGTRNDPYHETWEVCPGGGGGAICFTASYTPQKLLMFAMHGNVFERNNATYGGAMLINNAMPDDTVNGCYFNLVSNTLTNNLAINGSAPALFYNHSANLCLSCEPLSPIQALKFNDSKSLVGYIAPKYPTDVTMPLPRDGCGSVGDLWANNRAVGADTYSDKALATFVSTMEIQFCESGGVDCMGTARVGRSGGVLNVKATLRDADGIVVPRPQINVTLVISEEGGVGTELLVYNWKPRLLNQSNNVLEDIAFQTLQAPDDTTYQLTFVPVTTQGTIPPVVLNLTVRRCNLGEHLGKLHTCTLCDKGSFSLRPDIGCLPCAPKASCIAVVNETYTVGQGLLVPQPGYWKSSPYSPLPNRCPLVGACGSSSHDADVERTKNLLTLLSNQSYPLDNGTYNKFMSLQCSSAYSGRLCGACEVGHGRMGNRCIICLASPRWNAVLMFLALAFICLFVAMLTYNHAKNIMQRVRQAGLEVSHSMFAPNHGDTFTSVIKVIISYIQVLTILRSVQIDWPSHLLRFFSNVDVTSAIGWVSLDCSIPHRSPQTKAIARSMIAMFVPVLLMFFAAIFWWSWGWTSRARMQSWVRWPDFLALSIIQICFTLYTFSTGATMSLFACTEVDHVDDGSVGLKQYTVADPVPLVREDRFWSQNYEQRCMRGSHAIAAYGLGLPWLILFSLGFPIWSAAKLTWRRQQLGSYHYMLKYGFLYQEYQPKYYAWESVIMLRKVSLLAVVIFMRDSGNVVQLTTASLLLYLFILLHELVRPYQTQLVNGIERVSLFASMANIACLTFLAANANRNLRESMTVIIFIINVGVLAYFAFVLYLVGSQWVRQHGGKIHHAVQQMSVGLKRYQQTISEKCIWKKTHGKGLLYCMDSAQLDPAAGEGIHYHRSSDVSPMASPEKKGWNEGPSGNDTVPLHPMVRVPSPPRRDDVKGPVLRMEGQVGGALPAGQDQMRLFNSSGRHDQVGSNSFRGHDQVGSPVHSRYDQVRSNSLGRHEQIGVPLPASRHGHSRSTSLGRHDQAGMPSPARYNSLTGVSSPAGYDQARVSSPAGYDQARVPSPAGYDQARVPSPAGYDQAVRGPSPAGYDQARVPSPAVYDQMRMPSPAPYDQVRGSSLAGYDQARVSSPAGYNQARGPSPTGYDLTRDQRLNSADEGSDTGSMKNVDFRDL